MFDFIDALISAIGTGAEVAQEFAPDLLGMAGDTATGAAEFTPELAGLGLAGTEAAMSAAPSVVETAAPALMTAGTEFGGDAAVSSFGEASGRGGVYPPTSGFSVNAPDPSPASPAPAWTPDPGTPPGSVAEPPGPYGLPTESAGAPPVDAAQPPTSWESAQQIPGKWWQGVQAAPGSAGDYLKANPFKSLATAGVLGMGAYNAFNPPKTPAPPSFNFGSVAPPRSASDSPDVKGGPPRSPLVRSGGLNVKKSSGVGRPGGFGV